MKTKNYFKIILPVILLFFITNCNNVQDKLLMLKKTKFEFHKDNLVSNVDEDGKSLWLTEYCGSIDINMYIFECNDKIIERELNNFSFAKIVDDTVNITDIEEFKTYINKYITSDALKFSNEVKYLNNNIISIAFYTNAVGCGAATGYGPDSEFFNYDFQLKRRIKLSDIVISSEIETIELIVIGLLTKQNEGDIGEFDLTLPESFYLNTKGLVFFFPRRYHAEDDHLVEVNYSIIKEKLTSSFRQKIDLK